MNLFLARYAPLLIGFTVVLLLTALLLVERFVFPSFDLARRIEWMTYDWRVRSALKHPLPVSDNLGFVYVDGSTLAELNAKSRYQWPLPRKLYGHVVKELSAQGAQGVAFDIFFQDRQRDYPEDLLKFAGGGTMSSDDYFAGQIEKAGNVILSAPSRRDGKSLDLPAELFQSKAAALGHARGYRDSDGVLRRVQPFVDDPVKGRVWQLEIALTARALGLDLSRATVESRRIVIPGATGRDRVIPLDDDGNLLIDWSIRIFADKRVLGKNLLNLLNSYSRRGARQEIPPIWKDHLVIVGSTGGGNNISDHGATPIAKDDRLFGAHVNIANSLLMNRFIGSPSLLVEIALLVGMTFAAGLISWRLRALWASLAIACLAAGYVAFAWWPYVRHRYWLPVVLPVAGSLIMTHASMVAFRLVLERYHRHHVNSLFGKIVSPNIIEVLLRQPQASWSPSRRMMTVFFADIRGFTKFADNRRLLAEAAISRRGVAGKDAQRELDHAAADTMTTVNLYLAAVVDAVKRNNGTLDKYIGDCVMAFWGAPLPNERHACEAVHAAMDAQQGVARINAERAAENQQRTAQNSERVLRGSDPLQLLELLQVGIGLNSGIMTVGFMGSEKHLSNFTVFGDAVNLASRFQDLADAGVVIAGESTQREVVRQEPGLASSFVSQDPASIRGVAQPVATFRVLWATAGEEGPK